MDQSEAPAVTASPRPEARRVALGIYAVCVLVYALVMGPRGCAFTRPTTTSRYLADAYLHGTLSVRCDPEATRPGETCPPGGGGNDWARYNNKWFVAFPSFPAVLYMPAVAAGRAQLPQPAPSTGSSRASPRPCSTPSSRSSPARATPLRSWMENVALTALFAFGTVYFYTSVQGSVWFVAHVVGCALGAAYLLAALDCERPVLAGVLSG
jgi:hypothetical protein